RTRRGLSELEKGLAERLSQLSQKEKECSELLKDESRTYTNLFENVYSKTLNEQKSFEKRIRESLAEVEKSFGAIKQAGESEAGKVLCEYNRLYGLASEIEKELESKKELSKNSLAESFSLYESRLSARYSDLELQMQMLEKCFGESVKAQTQVALSELNDGRQTLSSIRRDLEELRNIGESKKAELETRYEEIESSLLAVKSQHENRLHDLVTTAGEAARSELSKQLEMLSEKYESGRREAERLYGELSAEVSAGGVMLSGLKEDLEALREESGLSYGEMLSKLNAELELLRENVELEAEALGASSRREYEKLCREHNEELKSLRALTNVSVKELRNEVEEKLSSSLKEVMSVTEEIKELRRGYAESLLNQNVAREDYLDSLKELR
ncbi:MAG: hypothetical protein UHW86_02995, partial [Spirochaetota bacterium]|nr:hypothetical protein [Spirochaetota bacterium]